MDNFGLPNRLCEMDESDFPNILEDEIFDPTKLDNYDAATPEWLDIFDDPVLNDRMMSEAITNPAIKSEHSYSLNKNGRLTLNAQALEDDSEPATDCISPMLIGDMETGAGTNNHQTVINQPTNITIQTSQPNSLMRNTIVKQEPKVIVQAEPLVFETRRPAQQQSLLKQNAIVLTTQVIPKTQDKITMHKVFPKAEPIDDDDVFYHDDMMPMTPPSSASSDSEGGQSPRRSPPPSPCHQVLITNKTSQRPLNPATALFSQPIPTSGVLVLTEEEKRTLISEGYPVPAKLPLTKHEEKNLKKVRRKIKNKISAQESRRKKKEYLDQLEKKVEDVAKENNDLRKKCENYESSNRSLISQLAKLQNMLKLYTPQPPQTVTQTGTCVMVLILCFAVFLGNWSPIGFGNSFGYGSVSNGMSSSLSVSSMSSPSVMGAYDTPTMKSSRTLMTMTEDVSTCGNEPWPLMLARRSFECIAQLISDYPTVDNVPVHPTNVVDSTDIPFTIHTPDGFNVA